MTTNEFSDEIERLAKSALDTKDREVLGASAALLVVAGALAGCRAEALGAHVMAFAAAELQRYAAAGN